MSDTAVSTTCSLVQVTTTAGYLRGLAVPLPKTSDAARVDFASKSSTNERTRYDDADFGHTGARSPVSSIPLQKLDHAGDSRQ